AIVHKIVTVHHGTISVQSTEGQGTTFQIALPCA
ncbi:ATP-binding protein, partial [candidate division KSB3 bacterium]|nr:ATP-binding protein [candidate division KSB3 bacterium]